MSGGPDALRARHAELAARAEAERNRLADQLGGWSGGVERMAGGWGWLGQVVRHLPIGVGLGVGLAAITVLRSPALRGALVVTPVAWRLARSVAQLVGRLRQ